MVYTIPEMRRGLVKRIHVNQHIIRENKKNKTNKEAITIQTSKGSFTAHKVQIHGKSKVIYSPDKPLKCGATVWVETTAPITSV